ncbi:MULTISPECIES: chlorohydrolase family protein [Arthrobacter]|uniref:Chlorohydrolase family protein n=2 Tax=Arthrobacter TaxID=1663 RepID=A0ABU9KH77_9MICC|nr:chlorohydrolase family protein [Arthrobacter sp. YJM1]MDP5226240.1 chlorohydrolase family protein [Arthrobacter sp. YJM1]
MKTLLTSAFVLAHGPSGHGLLRDGAVLVEDRRVAWVGPREEAPVAEAHRILGLGQSLLMPGLIDLDALADIDHLILDSWCDDEHSARLRWSEEYLRSARHDVLTAEERSTMRRYALAQLALHGITSFMPIAAEVNTAWAETHDDLLDLARTASKLGLRGFVGPSYRSGVHATTADGGHVIAFDDEEGRRGFEEAVRFLDTVEELADPLLTGVLMPCRIETVREELLAETARIAAERGVLVRVHALQGLSERSEVLREHGTTPLELLERTGLLNDRLLIAHGVYLDIHDAVHGEDRGDLATLAEAGASIIHCPLTNTRYADHLVRLGRYLDAGVQICLGTDSFPPDLIRGIDAGIHVAQEQYGEPANHFTADYINAATLGGARALHRPDLGRLESGATADLVAFALDDFRAGPVEDPIRSLLLSGTGRDCRFSMVDGRIVTQDGLIPGVDLEQLRRDGQAVFDKLRGAYTERDHLAGSVDELFPPVFPVH